MNNLKIYIFFKSSDTHLTTFVLKYKTICIQDFQD